MCSAWAPRSWAQSSPPSSRARSSPRASTAASATSEGLRRSKRWKGRRAMAKSRLHDLSELDQSVWIDFLSRHLLESGELARMMDEDAVVSIEVDPNLAYDTEATIAEAQRLHDLVDRPNCFVKIPATEPGLPAIEEMIARGRNINVTLTFSLQRYVEVAEAYLRGLERLVEGGGDPRPVAAGASLFVSRA